VIFCIYNFIPQFFETPDDGQSPKVQFVQYQHTIVRILQKLNVFFAGLLSCVRGFLYVIQALWMGDQRI
jgi:hypothetical protein